MLQFKVPSIGEVSRVCIAYKADSTSMFNVVECACTLGLNIVENVTKSRGDFMFQVIDLDRDESDLETHINAFVAVVRTMDGVISCSIGSFQGDGNEELFRDMSPVRICVISRKAETLSKLSKHFLFDLKLKIISHVQRSRGDVAFSVFDVEYKAIDFVALCKDVQEWEEVDECSLGNFNAGAMFPKKLALREPKGSKPAKKESDKADYYEGSSSKPPSPRNSLLSGILKLRSENTQDSDKIVIAMVGLPARGKSFTARKLKRFFSWKNNSARIFNAGRYRRESSLGPVNSASTSNAAVFDRTNSQGRSILEDAANRALDDLLKYLIGGGCVGIFDATNSTVERRRWIRERCRDVASVVFVEVLCDDEELLKENYLCKVRNSPDFDGIDEASALKDLQDRIAFYEQGYETLEVDECSYLKIFNMSNRLMANRVFGRLTRSMLPYVLSVHIGSRPIWFVRAGLAEDHLENYREGAPSTDSRSSGLCPDGIAFAQRLSAWVNTSYWLWRDDDATTDSTVNKLHEPKADELVETISGSSPRVLFSRSHHGTLVRTGDGRAKSGAYIKVLSSTLPRAVETAEMVKLGDESVVEPCPMLNPLDRGEHTGRHNSLIASLDSDFYEKWEDDPYYMRYPGGESYYDLVTRLETVLIEIEQQTAPVLVVSHISCIQVLLAYFLGTPAQESMNIQVPLHTVIQVTPNFGGSWDMTEFKLDGSKALLHRDSE